MNNYLFDLPGKNSWKRYLSSFVLIFTCYFLVSVMLVCMYYLLIHPGADIEKLDPLLEFFLSNLTCLVWLLAIFFFTWKVHQRSYRMLVTWRNRINWRRIFWGFGVFLGLIALSSLISIIISPSKYSLNKFDLKDFTYLVLIVVFLTPIQTTVEEVFFRGYLLQFLTKKFKNIYILSLIIAMIFGSMHFFNPEMKQSAILMGFDYIYWGYILTLIAIKTGTLEFSIGCHAANNMFLFLVFSDVNGVGGALPAPIRVLEQNPLVSVLLDAIILTTFYYLCMRRHEVRGYRELNVGKITELKKSH